MNGFYLDGDYIVELNGTKKKISLQKGQAETLETATLKVLVSKRFL